MAQYTKQFLENYEKSNPPTRQKIGEATIKIGQREFTIGWIWRRANGEIYLQTAPSIHGAGQSIKLKFARKEQGNEKAE